MKSTIKTVLILSLSLIVCASCSKKDDDEPTPNGSITPSGVISGTIENYTSGVIDSLRLDELYDDNDYVFGKGSISSTGEFSIKLDVPYLSKINLNFDNSTIVVSDTTVRVGGGFIIAYKNGVKEGRIIKSNLSSNGIDMGDTHCGYAYASKPVTAKGVGSDNGKSETYVYNYTLKKGWNEIAITETNNSITATSTIPSGLKWHYFKGVSYETKQQKAKRAFGVIGG